MGVIGVVVIGVGVIGVGVIGVGGDVGWGDWGWGDAVGAIQAVCCRDEEHCCPHSTSCDLERGRCVSPTGDVPMATKFPAWKRPRGAAAQPRLRVPAVGMAPP